MDKEIHKLLTFSASYKEDYFNTFTACQNVVDQAVISHNSMWDHIDVCEKHIRGDRPKDPKKLKKAGMAFSNNWNYFKARAKITADVAENIAGLKKSIYLMMPEFRRPRRDDDLDFLSSDEDRGVVSMKVSKVFAETLFREHRFSDFLNRIEYPSYSFGFCAVTFGDDDWLGEPIHPRYIAFEDKTKPDKIVTFVTFDVVKAQHLWEKWDNARKAETRMTLSENNPDRSVDISTTNWSVAGLESVLWQALEAELRKKYFDTGDEGSVNWEMVVNDFYNSPNYFIQNTRNITLAKVYHKELNGRWTETYIPYSNPWQSSPKSGGRTTQRSVTSSRFQTGDQIIYKKNWGKKSQDEVIILVKDSGFAEYGFISEYRGLAKFAVEDSIRHNRKRNNIEDKLIFAGSPIFFKGNSQTAESFKIMPAQGFTVIDRGVEIAPEQPKFDLSQHLASLAIDEQAYQRETSQFNPKVEGRLTSRPVKGEIQSISSEVNRSRSSKSDVKLSDYSKLMFNILSNLRKTKVPMKDDIGRDGYDYFYDELIYELRDFIPEKEDEKEWVKKILEAITTTQIESFIDNQEAIQLAISMAETSFARNRLKRFLLLSQGFPRREIDRIAPLTIDSMRNLKDERVAAIENDMMMSTNEVVIEETDDHVDHLNLHFKKFSSAMNGVSEGRLDPIIAFKWLSNVLSHSDLHLKMMERDPSYQVQLKPMMDVFTGFIQELNKLKAFAEKTQKARQEQAQAPQMSEKERGELKIKEFNATKKEERTQSLTANKARMNEVEQQHRHKLEEEDLAHKVEIDRVKADNEAQMQKIKTTASLF